MFENLQHPYLYVTVVAHFVAIRILALCFNNHPVYGKSFGTYDNKYWCTLQCIFVQCCIFIPIGLCIATHYSFDVEKLFNSSIKNGYSPYSNMLAYQVIAYMLTTMENCWPHWDLMAHHIAAFYTTLFFLYEDDSLDIYLLGIMCLEVGSCTLNIVEVIKMSSSSNSRKTTTITKVEDNNKSASNFEYLFQIANVSIFTLGHIIGSRFVYEITFIQDGKDSSPYFRYSFMFQSFCIMILRQKAAVNALLSFLTKKTSTRKVD